MEHYEMTKEQRATKAMKDGENVIKEYTHNMDNWRMLHDDVLLAIAYGKLHAFMLMFDNSLSCISFIEDYTNQLRNAIDKKNANSVGKKAHVDN